MFDFAPVGIAVAVSGVLSVGLIGCAPTSTSRLSSMNQLEKTNHTHLGQLISYAAGVDSKKVIWVADSFRLEHAVALQFLNENTTKDLSFFAVEVEPWRLSMLF